MLFKHDVISNTRLNGKFNLIRFKSLDPAFSFKIGQFATIKVKDGVLRCYSFVSSPEELPFWEIFVDTTPGGPGTTYLKALKPGQCLETQAVGGHFTLNQKFKKFIFGATGCGIAPFLPMLKSLSEEKGAEIYVYWGLRDKADVALTKLFKSYSELNDNFHFEVVLSRPGGKWKGKTGHITEELLLSAIKIPNKNAAIYLSGSGGFVADVRNNLIKKEFPHGNIFHEACY
jgi:NAD(P)H-flavin reductase